MGVDAKRRQRVGNHGGKLMNKIIIATALLLSSAASAQQAVTPMEQALSGKLSNEISLGLQCTIANLTMQHDLVAARERIKALEEKYEPKPLPSK